MIAGSIEFKRFNRVWMFFKNAASGGFLKRLQSSFPRMQYFIAFVKITFPLLQKGIP
jgi:hypothetical protein